MIENFVEKMYYHFRNSSKEWASLRKVGEVQNMAIQRVPKPTGTRFVTHLLNAIRALKNNWAGMIIHFSNKSACENCPEAIGYLNNFLLNFEFYYDACAYEDILIEKPKIYVFHTGMLH